MTDWKEEAFQTHLKRTESYFATVADMGDLAWFQVGNPRRDERIEEMGLPEDISEVELRRQVFMRRYLP